MSQVENILGAYKHNNQKKERKGLSPLIDKKHDHNQFQCFRKAMAFLKLQGRCFSLLKYFF